MMRAFPQYAFFCALLFAFAAPAFAQMPPSDVPPANLTGGDSPVPPTPGSVAVVAPVSPPVEIPPTAPSGPEPIPAIASSAPLLVIGQPAETPVVPEEEEEVSMEATLFFSAREMESIELAKKQFLEGSTEVESEEDLLDQLQGIKALQQPDDLTEKTFAQFYLKTLIYRTPTDWTIWVRESDVTKKYMPDTEIPAQARLKILAIGPEEVTFEWRPKNWQYVSTKFVEGRGMNIDMARQMLIFTLRVNQTLSAYDMEIKEGVVAESEANGKTAAPAPKPAVKKEPKKPAAPKPVPQAAPATPTPPNQQLNKPPVQNGANPANNNPMNIPPPANSQKR